jgi:DNA-directed RNA polymerase subunit alpha
MSSRSTLWTEGDDAPVEQLDLAVRTYNCLKRSNINSVGQLLALHKTELLNIRNFTVQNYEEVRTNLIEYGFMRFDRPIGPFIEDEDNDVM